MPADSGPPLDEVVHLVESQPAVDPVRLVFAAPSISEGEDWRERSLISWEILAGQEGLVVERSTEGPPGDAGTWCGNVTIADNIYQIHRGLRRAVRLGVTLTGETYYMASTWAEPVLESEGMIVVDPRPESPGVVVFGFTGG